MVNYYTYEPANKSLKQGHTYIKHRDTITVTECKDICKQLTEEQLKEEQLNEGQYIKLMKIDLSMYDKYDSDGRPAKVFDEYGDIIAENIILGKRKTAKYLVEENILRIYEDDLPVYENDNGVICRDKDALVDSLM